MCYSFFYFQCFIAVLYVLVGDPVALIEYLGFLVTVTFTLNTLGVLILKVKEPNTHRPLKVKMHTSHMHFISKIKLHTIHLIHHTFSINKGKKHIDFTKG